LLPQPVKNKLTSLLKKFHQLPQVHSGGADVSFPPNKPMNGSIAALLFIQHHRLLGGKPCLYLCNLQLAHGHVFICPLLDENSTGIGHVPCGRAVGFRQNLEVGPPGKRLDLGEYLSDPHSGGV
jgi:hypothetical protein